MTTQQKANADIIAEAAKAYGVDPQLAIAVAKQENGSLSSSVSDGINRDKSGQEVSRDIGLMQVNSKHINETYTAPDGSKKTITEAMLRDPKQNAEIAICQVLRPAYNRASKTYSGDQLVQATYAYYNKGPNQTLKWEEMDYRASRNVLGYYNGVGGDSDNLSFNSDAEKNMAEAARRRTPYEDLIGVNPEMLQYPPQAFRILSGQSAENQAKAQTGAPTGPDPNPFQSGESPDGGDRLKDIKVEYKFDEISAQKPRSGVVRLKFEDTEDEVSSDQYIQSSLKTKFEDAIKDICKSYNITTINISSTRNGTHGDTSNHYRGGAIDISAINGRRIRDIGKSQPVIIFQETFEKFGFHENMGPAMMKRDGGNVNNATLAANHKNHIHISIAGGWEMRRPYRLQEAEEGEGFSPKVPVEPEERLNEGRIEGKGVFSVQQQLADYVFYLNYYSKFSCTLNMPWTPSMAVGFPVLVLDSSNLDESMIGSVQAVTHSFTPEAAVTVTSISHYRHYKTRTPKFDPGVGGNTLVPMWYDENYFDVAKMTDEFYKKYLGDSVFSISDLNKSMACAPSAWVESMAKEYKSILKASDYGTFKIRDLMTFEEWMEWNGVKKSGESLEGKLFHGPDNPIIAGDIEEKIDFRTPVIEHVNLLKRAGILL